MRIITLIHFSLAFEGILEYSGLGVAASSNWRVPKKDWIRIERIAWARMEVAADFFFHFEATVFWGRQRACVNFQQAFIALTWPGARTPFNPQLQSGASFQPRSLHLEVSPSGFSAFRVLEHLKPPKPANALNPKSPTASHASVPNCCKTGFFAGLRYNPNSQIALYLCAGAPCFGGKCHQFVSCIAAAFSRAETLNPEPPSPNTPNPP